MILKDLLVIELASVLAGPSVGMWLAELGAKVIKVEHHRNGGDVTRSWKLPTEPAGTDRPAYFTAVNWGKQSIGIDLKSAQGRQILLQLTAKADILIASFKPGDAVKMGLDPQSLMAHNPGLIYADLTAYGPDDPRTGFDAIIQAEAGFTYMNGPAQGEAVKMPVALVDVLAAHQLKEGILLALLKKMQSGKGSHVQTSLLKSAMAALVNQATNWLTGGHIPQRMGSDHPNIVPYGTIFKTADGHGIVLAVGNDRQFEGLCAALAAPELARDARFRHNRGRVLHRAELQPALAVLIQGWQRDALLPLLQAAKVPCGAVLDMQEVMAQPQAQDLSLEADGLRGLRSLALEGWERGDLSAPPHLCAHSGEILQKLLGMEVEEIQNLQKEGIIGSYGQGK